MRWAPWILVVGTACSGSGTDDDGVDTADDGASMVSPADVEVSWAEAFDTSSAGALSGVWGAASDDVWIVGGDEVGEAWHFDGADWTATDVPDGTALLVWVYGFASDDVYAVGVDGSFVHWDGASWSVIDTGTDEDLWGIFGHAADDLWIVGGDPDTRGDCGSATKTCMWHWDGTTFDARPIAAAQNARGATSLFKIWGIGDEVFAVGQRGLILRQEGESFVAQSAGEEANQDFVSLWGTSDDRIVAVGGRGNAKVSLWDGAAFDTVSPSGFGGLNAVWTDEAGLAHVGGVAGFVGMVDTSTLELTWEESLGTLDVHAMWGDGEGKVYAVGGRFLAPYEGSAWVGTVSERAP